MISHIKNIGLAHTMPMFLILTLIKIFSIFDMSIL